MALFKGTQRKNKISATNGADTVMGLGGNDTLSGRGGNDRLYGGAGEDRLAGGKGNDRLYGGGGNDTVLGDQGNDKLYGGAGNDVLEGGDGADLLSGGGGNDTATYALSPAAVNVDLGRSRQSGGAAEGDALSSIERLIGSSFGDRLAGAAASERIEGGAGDDVIDGGAGADVLDGGPGLDTLSYATSASGVTASLALSLQAGGSAEGDTTAGFEHLTGSIFVDVLTGDHADNVIDGGPGDDLVTGGAGADTLVGGGGVDRLSYALSAAAVRINLSQALQSGGDAEGDIVTGFTGVVGSAFDDRLRGTLASDALSGGDGNDDIDGSVAGVDGAEIADIAPDLLNGGDGNDILQAGAGDTVFGGAGDDRLVARGSGSGLSLSGGAGNDWFEIAAFERDVLIDGGSGADRFLLAFTPLNGSADGMPDGLVEASAVISGFEPGSDKIGVTGHTAEAWYAAIALSGANTLFDDAGVLVIQASGSGLYEVRISGLSVATFTASDILVL